MKNFVKILLPFLILISFFSCRKKERIEYHKLTYEVKFLAPANGSFCDVSATPAYSEKPPFIDRFNLPEVWRYEYKELKKGDKVRFHIWAQLRYHYEVRVFIDDVEVSYVRARVSDHTYYATYVEEFRGRNDNSNQNSGVIQFTY